MWFAGVGLQRRATSVVRAGIPARHRSRPSAIGFASDECRAGSGEAGGDGSPNLATAIRQTDGLIRFGQQAVSI